MAQTTEQAFESYLQRMLAEGGWLPGAHAEWDKVRALVANPLDKFQLGVRKLVEDLMIQRMAENDKIVTRYVDDGEFQRTAFPIPAQKIFEAVHAQHKPLGDVG